MNGTLEVTATFTTVKGFNKAYNTLRDQILIRHGFEPGAKVRLKDAIRLQVSFDGENFFNCGTVKSDMKERIKMNEKYNNSKNIYKLVALV